MATAYTTETTGYGTWTNHGDQYNHSVAASIETAFGDIGPEGYDLDAIEDEYRAAINEALPGGIVLAGSDFYGPVGADASSLSEAIEDVDLGAIIDRHQIG